MTTEDVQGDEPLVPMAALTLDALRQAVAAVAPSRLPEFFQDIQNTFSQVGEEDSVFPIRHFCQRWGATVAFVSFVWFVVNSSRTAPHPKRVVQLLRPRHAPALAYPRRVPTGCELDSPPSTTIAWPFT